MISEFNPTEEAKRQLEVLENHQFRLGRMIGGSKSFYRSEHKGNIIAFNANIITASSGKIWYGDLDITLDAPALKSAAKEINEDLYILSEADARFGEENKDIDLLMSKALYIIKG